MGTFGMTRQLHPPPGRIRFPNRRLCRTAFWVHLNHLNSRHELATRVVSNRTEQWFSNEPHSLIEPCQIVPLNLKLEVWRSERIMCDYSLMAVPNRLARE